MKINCYILFLLINLVAFPSLGEESYTLREFDKEEIQKIKNNPDFDYSEEIKDDEEEEEEHTENEDEESSEDESGSNFIVDFFDAVGSSFAYIALLVIVVLLIATIISSDTVHASTGKEDEEFIQRPELENLDEVTLVDLKSYLQESLEEQDYRSAVRFHYLICLKILSDSGTIIWKSDKTNRDYYYEIKDKSLARLFEGITFHFDYVWYGGLIVDQMAYENMKKDFKDFENNLTLKKA